MAGAEPKERLRSIPTLNYVSGTLMLIAWMTTGTLGMMVARYMKGMAKGQNLCGKDVWFLVRHHKYNNVPQSYFSK